MIVLGFLAGGTAGVVLTGTTEVYVLPDRVGTNALIGVIEEGGKALILVAVALLVRPRVPRDGMVLGLTVGAGFAAFESAGYALTALIQHGDDHPVLHVLQTEASEACSPRSATSRGRRSSAARSSRPRGRPDGSGSTGGWWGRSSAWSSLHGLWDASYGLAIRISLGIGGYGWDLDWPDTAAWVGTPSGGDLWRFQVAYDVLLGGSR